jgi:hypothetical protein
LLISTTRARLLSDGMDTNVWHRTEQTSSSSLGGKPKGTTNEAKSEQAESRVNAKKWCAIKYDEHNRHRVEIDKKKRAKMGVLEELMRQASKKLEVPLADLHKEKIRGYKRRNHQLRCTHRGPLSPMHKVEANLLKVILLRGAMCQTVSYGEGLELASSIIEDTLTQLQFIQWKILHLGKSFRVESVAMLGQKYSKKSASDTHET